VINVNFGELCSTLKRILIKLGFDEKKAELCSKLFAETSLDGIHSHGVNRFPRFIDYIKKGYIKIDKNPTIETSFGALERWNGNLGPGNTNAYYSMKRAVEIAKTNGIGCVALNNTNHWMRGGSYGIAAADENCLGICWTNTSANLPSWGSQTKNIGNNPIVFASPYEDKMVLLDMAMSMYSYGKMEIYMSNNQLLPTEGGYDRNGLITKSPSKILDSERPLPIGYWKGSGFSILLDLFASVLSGGLGLSQISKLEAEYKLSQIFIAFDLDKIGNKDYINGIIKQLIDNVHSGEPVSHNEKIYYPGERTAITRKNNLEKGIPVDENIWEQIDKMD